MDKFLSTYNLSKPDHKEMGIFNLPAKKSQGPDVSLLNSDNET